MRYELVDGQGNFGSIDGDAPAAMRYTEARMANFGEELLADIHKNTVDFTENFDGSLTEPSVMPANVPNLLVNGASGIAVGMSTSIPPHNLGEVCDAVIYLLENWEHLDSISVNDLMHFIKGPDFPTAGIIYTGDEENDGLVTAYATGRGKVTVRAKVHIEDLGRGRSRIVITEIPFQINKTSLIERIVAVAQEGKIEGLVDLRDESDRQGLRLVVEIGRQAEPADVLKSLFKYTPLQSTFSLIMISLVDNEPRTLGLKQMLRVFIEHRLEVIRRRSEFDLARAKERAHILEGLITALDNIDAIIDTIRRSRTTETARENLMKQFGLSEIQATAILDMQLRRLAGLERKKIQDELKEKRQLIKDLTTLLSSEFLMRMEVARETKIVREAYVDERRTIIVRGEATDVTKGDLIGKQENTWITMTTNGRISRPHNGDAPKVTAAMKEPPFRVLASNTGDILYLITEDGNCVTLLASQVPKANEVEDGTSFWEMSALRRDEKVVQIISVPPGVENGYFFFVTEMGEVKRLKIDEMPGMRASSFKVFDVEKGDKIGWVFLTADNDNVMLVTRQAQAIQFNSDEVRPSGLTAGGVRGIKLAEKDDWVVGAGVVVPDSHVWVVTDEGIGKRTPIEEYPTQGRAGSGVRTMKLPPGNNQGIAAAVIHEESTEVIALTQNGRAKRSKLGSAPAFKRDYKGEGVVSLAKGEKVASAFIYEPRIELAPSVEIVDADPEDESLGIEEA